MFLSIITLIVQYCLFATVSVRLLPISAILIFCTLSSHTATVIGLFDHQDEGIVVFWNVRSYLPVDLMSHPGRLESLAALLQGSQILHCSYFFSLQGSRCVPERDSIVSRIGHQAVCFISDVQILTKRWRWRKHYFSDGRDVDRTFVWTNFEASCNLFLISNFHRVLNRVYFLLGNSPVSEFYMPTFRNTVCFIFIGG
jgi:hypothetical protein